MRFSITNLCCRPPRPFSDTNRDDIDVHNYHAPGTYRNLSLLYSSAQNSHGLPAQCGLKRHRCRNQNPASSISKFRTQWHGRIQLQTAPKKVDISVFSSALIRFPPILDVCSSAKHRLFLASIKLPWLAASPKENRTNTFCPMLSPSNTGHLD